MDDYELLIADEIVQYKSNPYNTIQVNKQDCRVLVRINDMPLNYTFFEDEGESMLLPINDLIPKSGEQNLTIEVYPKSTEETISDKAHVNIKLIYAESRATPLNEYQVMQELNLPEGMGDQKLPKYEIKGTFTATVPFDFSKELENAKDLKSIPDIEQKVVAKYKQLGNLLLDNPKDFVLNEYKNSFLKFWSYNYFTKKELEERGLSSIYNLNFKNRQLEELENYEMIFYHNNQLVLLRDKEDKTSALAISYLDDETTTEKSYSSRFALLYMPEGSKELKVW